MFSFLKKEKAAEDPYKKNLSRFMACFDEFISAADRKFPSSPDCRPYIQPRIDHTLELSRDQIRAWTESTDVKTLAVKVLYNVSFEALSSGALHLYRGHLDPLQPSDKLMYIVDLCLDYYFSKGIVTAAQKKDQKDILMENIAAVG